MRHCRNDRYTSIFRATGFLTFGRLVLHSHERHTKPWQDGARWIVDRGRRDTVDSTEPTDKPESTDEDGEPDDRTPSARRRTVLLTGASGLALSGFGITAANELLPGGAQMPSVLGTASSPTVGITKTERVYSAARGRRVDLVSILPSRKPSAELPVVLLLHGLHGRARSAAPAGLAGRLVTEVSRGALPPFAFVAVDGGDSYWHEHYKGDDPLGMLLNEVPRWLRQRRMGGPDGQPFACAGVSMGGFGALVYGRRRWELGNPAGALVGISPALLTSWREMRKRNAFKDAADWASLDPLRHPTATGSTPVGVWCGNDDRFIEGVRRYVPKANPTVADIGPGKHGASYFRSTVPGVLSFLGKYAPEQHDRD
ncbi:MAG: alpha/beta hydrolase [Pseudonocardiaceae bacterium]|nr:alpha/beta hydrolase [Pseudonocardiaceae bacterium]